jgi:hypothetical protein
MRAALPFSSLLLTTLIAAAGCDGCAPDPSDSNDGNNPLPTGPGGSPTDPTDPTDPQQGALTLRFEGTAPVNVFYGQSVQLPFALTKQDGSVQAGATVSVAVNGTGGQLNVSQAVTDAAGTARVTFTAGTENADLTVTASAERVVNDEVVSIRVRVNPVGSLTVAISSITRLPVSRAELLVYRGAQANVPSCAALRTASTLPTATFAADFNAVPGQRTFTDQPHGQVVTVLASGYSARGDLIGLGCSDGSAILGGGTTTVTVAIEQLPTTLEGDYDVLMKVNLGNALPDPYDTYLDTVTGALSDPAGYVVYQTLKSYNPLWWYKDLGEGEREYSFAEVSANPQNWPSYTSTQSLIDTLLANQLGQNYVTVKTVGGDLRKVVTEFEVGTRLNYTLLDAGNSVYAVDEKWNDVVFTWRLSCPGGDLGCARRAVQLTDANYAPVATAYTAVAQHAPVAGGETERFSIQNEQHLFALRYGAVIMIALNEVIFPSLPGGLAGNSFEEVLGNIINCTSVGEEMNSVVMNNWLLPPVSAQNFEVFCNVGLSFAAGYLEQQLLDLQVGGGEPQLAAKEQTGALGSGQLYLVDKSHDLFADTVQELEFLVQWNNPDNGGASEDIATPIKGDGRLAATNCTSDSSCSGSLSCQAIPHYLKVQLVEQTCAKPVGASLGEDACTTNNQCASGLCVGAGTPGATCFSACGSDLDCGLGACVDDGASLNLESVMAGLGSTTAPTCLLP